MTPFRVTNDTNWLQFKKIVAEKWGVPVKQQRYWYWVMRQNRSVRVASPLDAFTDHTPVCLIEVVVPAPVSIDTQLTVILHSTWQCAAQTCSLPRKYSTVGRVLHHFADAMEQDATLCMHGLMRRFKKYGLAAVDAALPTTAPLNSLAACRP